MSVKFIQSFPSGSVYIWYLWAVIIIGTIFPLIGLSGIVLELYRVKKKKLHLRYKVLVASILILLIGLVFLFSPAR